MYNFNGCFLPVFKIPVITSAAETANAAVMLHALITSHR